MLMTRETFMRYFKVILCSFKKILSFFLRFLSVFLLFGLRTISSVKGSPSSKSTKSKKSRLLLSTQNLLVYIMMEGEIEKLYTEAVPNKRGKMSVKHLDHTFRKIGIPMRVQQIRSLFFRYDKTKTKQLDLNEFRQLIEDIAINPQQAHTLQG